MEQSKIKEKTKVRKRNNKLEMRLVFAWKMKSNSNHTLAYVMQKTQNYIADLDLSLGSFLQFISSYLCFFSQRLELH